MAASWMLARFLSLAVMWRLGFWHGRWGTLLLAAVALAGGLALVLLAPGLGGVVAGLLHVRHRHGADLLRRALLFAGGGPRRRWTRGATSRR